MPHNKSPSRTRSGPEPTYDVMTGARYSILIVVLLAWASLVVVALRKRPKKSVLPPELELKRATIAKAHNRRVFLLLPMLAVLFSLLFLSLPLVPHSWSKAYLFGFILLIIAPLEGYAIYRVSKFDDRLCKDLDFMCPHCHKPLYEPSWALYVT